MTLGRAKKAHTKWDFPKQHLSYELLTKFISLQLEFVVDFQ